MIINPCGMRGAKEQTTSGNTDVHIYDCQYNKKINKRTMLLIQVT